MGFSAYKRECDVSYFSPNVERDVAGMNFTLHYLADVPQHTEACAAWAYGRWGVQRKEGSLSRALTRFQECAQKDGIPLTLVATHNQSGLPVAMGSLWREDGRDWPHLTPWISSVFTLYRYRGNGIAKTMITRLEEEAWRLGFGEVFLQSGSAANYYVKLGYEALETKIDADNAAGTLSLFRKVK